MGRDIDNQKKWMRDNLKSYNFRVNRVTESDVMEHLDKQPNKRGYIIRVIRGDIKKHETD